MLQLVTRVYMFRYSTHYKTKFNRQVRANGIAACQHDLETTPMMIIKGVQNYFSLFPQSKNVTNT